MRQNKNSNVTNDVVNNNVLIDNCVAINDIHNPDIKSSKKADGDTVEITLATKMNVVRQIWLAGLGAYGNSIDGLNIAGEKSSMFFEELLRQGEKVDKTFKLHTAGEYISLHGLETLIQRTYTKLTGVESDRITQLNNKLDNLLTLLEDKK
ncbi:Putative uncharacterized protein [Moritella viscosa]|uniref:Uncharacterized protein n=1 Tax=Moritella viscosa TaxID=80854 RepID=A0A090IAB2_9GAMM|nr:phasin family protein [Moritella viscosa]CED58681.1 putative uncharacterized protein [Moritella viscosa]SGY83698.1 Putative uncharacterized protein [Moritella viscosa]SGY84171.1 Putative uncharacterized protein [Moritella viscosa]SHN97397.1 Putative uncharacterized protein [Moritella viscosa]SHN97399.1 Putative uncharacterized protein [Moritella viscosa]